MLVNREFVDEFYRARSKATQFCTISKRTTTPTPIMQSKGFDLNWMGPGIFRLSKTPIKYNTNNMDMNILVGRDASD